MKLKSKTLNIHQVGDLVYITFPLFEKHGIKTISFLFNNAHETEEYIIAGTRGWCHL